MKKSLLIILIIVAIIIGISTFLIITNVIKHQSTIEEQDVRNYILESDLIKPSGQKEDNNGNYDVLTFSSRDKESLARNSDFIIIGKVDSIENEYWDEEAREIRTIGIINVKKVFKGDLKKGQQISFLRYGGIVTISEYEKSLTSDQIKEYGLDKLTQEEKENNYILKGKIPVQKNKTYLMYMEYDTTLKRYRLLYSEDGLREVDTSRIILNYEKVKVKDNETGEYVELKDAISSTLLKKETNWFSRIINFFIKILPF